MRKPWPLKDGDPGQELLEDRPHRAGAEQQRLVPAAQMQNAVREDVATFEVTRQLHLVDGDEGGARLARHGLHRAHRIARVGRRYLFFTRHQRDVLRPDLLDHTRIDLARQQPQRQADNAAAVRHHTLDGIMGLAGIGRSEHRGYAASAQDHRLRIFSHWSMHGRETTVFRSASSSWKKGRDDDHM